MREKKIKLAKKQEETTDTVKLEDTKRPKKLTGELKDKTEKKSDVGKDAEYIEETSENIIIEVLEKEEKEAIEEALKEHEENEEAE